MSVAGVDVNCTVDVPGVFQYQVVECINLSPTNPSLVFDVKIENDPIVALTPVAGVYENDNYYHICIQGWAKTKTAFMYAYDL